MRAKALVSMIDTIWYVSHCVTVCVYLCRGGRLVGFQFLVRSLRRQGWYSTQVVLIVSVVTLSVLMTVMSCSRCFRAYLTFAGRVRRL